MKHFGDSYDIVKKSLLNWLAEVGPWVAHPMFTHVVCPKEAKEFEIFLGAPLLSCEHLHSKSDRKLFFQMCQEDSRHGFLDPDTGLKISPGSAGVHHVASSELRDIAQARPNYLIMVFDQSLNRSKKDPPERQIARKLAHFSEHGIYGFAYLSHAAFLVVGCRRALVERAFRVVVRKLRLPQKVFVLSTDERIDNPNVCSPCRN